MCCGGPDPKAAPICLEACREGGGSRTRMGGGESKGALKWGIKGSEYATLLYFNHLAELCFSPEKPQHQGVLRGFAHRTAPARVSEYPFFLDASTQIASESEAGATEWDSGHVPSTQNELTWDPYRDLLLSPLDSFPVGAVSLACHELYRCDFA